MSLRGPMTIIEMAAIVIAVAFALIVGYLVRLMIQVRKTFAEAERLLININDELPSLIGKIHAMSQNVIELTQQARIGVEHASVFLHSVGEVGESVERVYGFLKGASGAMLPNVASLVTRLRKVVSRRFSTRSRAFPFHPGIPH
jgi:uncharacterized protein YoxC